ncbi:outer membrane protein assembly factor BamB family protein [Tuwongella immobilis]|uniref:Pyrrolo-quinoline quinone repeat domain-containing protein n=1 Tax=Tuwongella immobilis TaxID=692036 RepID=A0A6C2YSJ4_9BACT|nr:PQQ-binding-like beta-propeller repeat protein [Tuwongella immobilis]VIP04660.1 Uncharacterized protein OS=Planctomyces maris DSM 8797 GN=PM8797T_21598 PE=4 SV=1: PQQ_3: PQQ_2: PQQ_3 [Tuwongella immobilis]VTS06681.1 Uncharacterized protein OS=Planctomyces maris DSM 8797 GN=PM8797T_21598 PE=4 SV=1: PQQ_3: PQQ_2: PQQ_3 [Tuwongella immobilis]
MSSVLTVLKRLLALVVLVGVIYGAFKLNEAGVVAKSNKSTETTAPETVASVAPAPAPAAPTTQAAPPTPPKPMVEAPKPVTPPAPKPEMTKPEAPKPEAPKPEAPKPVTPPAPKPETPKPETPKPETPKPVTPPAPKPETPKPETPKPVVPAVPLKPATPAAPAAPAATGAKAVLAPVAGSWAMFGGSVVRNMVNPHDKDIPTEFDVPGGEGVKWKAELGSKSYGGPTIAAGKVFVGTNNDKARNPRDREKPAEGEEEGKPLDKGVLMAFDEKTGQFLWQHVNDKLPSGQVNDWPHEGVCSTPTVEGNRLYYVTNRCELVCLDVNGFLDSKNDGITTEKYQDKTDADVIWAYDLMANDKVFPHNMSNCAPLIVGDLLFIVTANGVDEGHINIPAPEAPSFMCLEKATGKPVWRNNLPGRNIMHGQWSNPSYAEIKGVPQVMFPGGDGVLYSFEPKTGKLLWKFACNPKDAKYELGGRGTKSDFIATPVIWQDKVYIGTGQDPEHLDGIGHLWCIDPTKATPDADGDISPKDEAFDPKAPVNAKSGLVWHFGGKETKPNSKREFVFGRTMSTVAIVDGILYVAELNGFFFCLDANTGKKFYLYDLKSGIWGSPYFVDGKIYIGNEDGDLFIFRHVAKPEAIDDDVADRATAKKLKADIEKKYLVKKLTVDEPIRSTPVVANGVLYILTERSLVAIGKKD